MDYQRIYYNIVNVAKDRESQEGIYYESHHIIPKSIIRDNSPDNLVNLTLREHFICHLLLTKIYTGINQIKMEYALKRMIPRAELNCNKNRSYDYYRTKYMTNLLSNYNKPKFVYNSRNGKYNKLIQSGHLLASCIDCKLINYIKNNMKCFYCNNKITDEIKIQISEITKNPKCLCGCNMHTSNYYNMWIKNHITNCACGCGKIKIISQNLTNPAVYIHGHNKTTDEINNRRSNTLKQTLKQLTPEQMAERLKKSLSNCDHQKRNRAISEGKVSIIKVTYPDGNEEFMKSNQVKEKLGVSWAAVNHAINKRNGFQQLTGNTYEMIKKYQPGVPK